MHRTHHICTTVSRPHSHKLFVNNGALILEAETEVELVREAKKKGIYFSELRNDVAVGPPECFSVAWLGSKDTADYLRWKGVIGPAVGLRETIRKERERGVPT